ncbi:MAG: adenine-specific methyltransferase EcoRI family protein [Lentisphaeria bacterium]|nr:adenine-specific methyltransferase EcoRI family protein [Lentisphaeria bacterium]
MEKKNGNAQLHQAGRNKKDDFYTALEDIEKELKHYPACFKGKTVFCNCDDPYESNFFKYFVMHFNSLGLKKLIAACCSGSSVPSGPDMPEGGSSRPRRACKVIITEVKEEDGDGKADVEYLLKNRKNVLSPLNGNGDFRSEECIELLRESDIVVTNPPFSLFREYVRLLVRHGKKFLIIGNQNAVTYKEIFPLIKENRLWFGASIHSGDREFRVPDDYPLQAAGCCTRDGKKYIRVKGVRWFTNLDHKEHHKPLPLHERYQAEKYPRYDNYDAIEVRETRLIPQDYTGAMGVPITFLDKYCPEQFEIIKFRKGDDGKDLSINGECPYFRILIRRKAAGGREKEAKFRKKTERDLKKRKNVVN